MCWKIFKILSSPLAKPCLSTPLKSLHHCTETNVKSNKSTSVLHSALQCRMPETFINNLMSVSLWYQSRVIRLFFLVHYFDPLNLNTIISFGKLLLYLALSVVIYNLIWTKMHKSCTFYCKRSPVRPPAHLHMAIEGCLCLWRTFLMGNTCGH